VKQSAKSVWRKSRRFRLVAACRSDRFVNSPMHHFRPGGHPRAKLTPCARLLRPLDVKLIGGAGCRDCARRVPLPARLGLDCPSSCHYLVLSGCAVSFHLKVRPVGQKSFSLLCPVSVKGKHQALQARASVLAVGQSTLKDAPPRAPVQLVAEPRSKTLCCGSPVASTTSVPVP
jgi:hypothetical protein